MSNKAITLSPWRPPLFLRENQIFEGNVQLILESGNSNLQVNHCFSALSKVEEMNLIAVATVNADYLQQSLH